MEFKYCPLCESSAIRKKKGKRALQLKKQTAITPVIEYWECERCGEVFYPHETSKKLDAVFLAAAKRKPA
jgi:YgiT-type zinc finger domain-containing protein